MTQLHLPWLELAILIPVIGGVVVARLRDAEKQRRFSLQISSLVFLCTIAAWVNLALSGSAEAVGRWGLVGTILGRDAIVIDWLNSPLICLGALLHLLTILATLRTKVRRFPFSFALISEGILLAIFSCRQPGLIILLLALQCAPMVFELRARGNSARVFVLHMSLFIVLAAAGCWIRHATDPGSVSSAWASGLLAVAILIRCGTFPLHSWLIDFFENATLGAALPFAAPLAGAYAFVRLVLPFAPDWMLHVMAWVAVWTAVYSACLCLTQKDGRRFFGYLFVSQSSLVMAGLALATLPGLAGALCVWISASLSLTGFGLTLGSLEARNGPLRLDRYHGLYDHVPTLAAFFLITGLACIGFPGTLGFVGAGIIVEAAVKNNPLLGLGMILATALNSIAVLQAYFRFFTGRHPQVSISLRIRIPERIAALVLTALLLGGGLFPNWSVASRFRAATIFLSSARVVPAHTEAPGE